MSSKRAVNTNAGDQLTIYSSLPLQGPGAAASASVTALAELAATSVATPSGVSP